MSPNKKPEDTISAGDEMGPSSPSNPSPSSGVHSRTSEELVVSGISGRFPESDNLEEFRDNLFNGVDMITEDGRRWTPGLNGLPTRSGKLKTLDKFDAQFFGVHPKQAEFMDPQLRMLLEVTHEAIIDAGVNPATIRGTKTGVFVGASSSESEKIWLRNSDARHGYALTGCNRGMFSNRVSFSFDFHGPSFTVDTACSSSFIALEQAIASIRLGHCDAAVVAGTHICLEPNMSLQFHRLSMLSPDGSCKSFDASGNGYVRSEAVVAVFIQKKDVALRSYASILAARTNSDGHKEKGVTFPSGQRQAELLQETYKEAGIDPKDVVYIEAHGTGTQAGDPQELNAIADVFCKNREKEKPLLIGSVKSNAGHAEPGSGLMSMAKVLLSMQQGILPANLHYKTPNPNIPALCDGRLKAVAQNTPWDGGIVGLNSFGFGGANVHIILKSNPKKNLKTKSSQNPAIPLLIPFSGRTRDSVEFALRQIAEEISSSDPVSQNLERIHLLHKISLSEIPHHSFRGHTVISPGGKPFDCDILENTGTGKSNSGPSSSSTPVWFIFTGMGSQWPEMGRDLLTFQTFADSIMTSADVLKPHGLDLMNILLDKDEKSLSGSVTKCFVAIASIQVALVDLLKSVGVTPSGGIVGHSVGELGCAYADGCFTASQTVLAALARGRAIMESTSSCTGAMAAVGLSWEEAKTRCPPGIYPACHNSKDSVTISGPKSGIQDFVNTLKNEGIFAKEVDSSGMAFHSKYIESARPQLQKLLDDLIPNPRPRSSHWISSSIPENEWDSPLAQFSSADYHVNNLLSPVLFQEALQKIPDNSIVIEIGPHALLQAILKRSLPNCVNLGLVNKNHPDKPSFLLQALGKLYNSGLNLELSALYPSVDFPVAVDTPSISPLVKWDHSLTWDVPRYPENDSMSSSESFGNLSMDSDSSSGEVVMEISLNEESQKFYADHKIDGRIIFPATGYFLLIWKAFARLQKKEFEQVPIVLEGVSIIRATVLPLDGAPVKFLISIFKGTGEFQIQESDVVIVTGIVRSPSSSSSSGSSEFLPLEPPPDFNRNDGEEKIERIPLSKADAYKELRLRGYEYSGSFQGIHISDTEGGWAKLKWQKNWVSFLDTVLQVAILHKDTRALYLPTYLDKAIFDPVVFLQSLQQQVEEQREKAGISSNDDDDDEEESPLEKLVPVFNYPDLTVVTCEGIQFQRWKAGMAPRRSTTSSLLRLEKFKFTPYLEKMDKYEYESFENCLLVCLDIVLENIPENTLKMLEILGSGNATGNIENDVISTLAQAHVLNQPLKDFKGRVLVPSQRSKVSETLKNAGIKVTLSTTENEAKIIQKVVSSFDLVITDETNHLPDFNTLRDQGFLLYHKQHKNSNESESETILDFKRIEGSFGLVLVSHKISPSRHFYLFKKSLHNFSSAQSPSKNLCHVVEINLNPDESPSNSLSHFNYSWVEELKMAMGRAVELKDEPSFRIYLVSKENCEKSGQNIPSGVLGLVNTLRKEPGGLGIRCFFLRNSPKIANDLNFLKPSKSLSTVLQRDLVMNVFDENVWGSMRFYCLPEPTKMTRKVDHAYLNAMTRGDLSSLRWFESSLKYYEPKSDVCSVYYSPLNFRDVMLCTGKLALDSLPNNLGTKECVLGLEWSGKTPDGTRVMGVVPTCGLATSIVPDREFLWEVPTAWSLAEAATVPVVYATAFYALVVRGKIQSGESILIHAGAGGVGMAAIRVALSLNCTVYTTVGSREKRNFLMKTFPQLNESSFAHSRDSSFLEHILRETRGRGVDLVLNSLAGDQLKASIKCLAYQGRFLEIGKVDLFKNSSLGMSILLKNVSVHGILLDGLRVGDSDKRRTWELVQEGLNSGVVQPLNSTIFTDSDEQIEQAFRFMASGKHVGKILIEIRKENENESKLIEALPRAHFDPKKSYIIIGGLGGFGLELCGWLVERGARKLALVSRSGVRNGYQDSCLRRWRKEGATVITPTTDITTLEGATTLLKESTVILRAPIGGIFNLAMVLADGLMEKQSAETFQTVSRPKINSSILLDQVSRTLAPSLEYFVVFSSVSSGRGAVGLSNYAWANSGMERICENRQKDGFPALAIMWGAIGDVGVLQEDMGLGNEAVVGGTSPQRISSCLNTMDILLHESKYHKEPVLSSMVLCEKKTGKVSIKSGAKTGEAGSSLSDKVGHILGIKPEAMPNINPQMKLYEMGMDSLMSVEIKQIVEMTTGITLNSSDMVELTFEKIKNLKGQEQNKPNQNDSQVDTDEDKQQDDEEEEVDIALKSLEQSKSTTFENHTSTVSVTTSPSSNTAQGQVPTSPRVRYLRKKRRPSRPSSEIKNSKNADSPALLSSSPAPKSNQHSTIPNISSILQSTWKSSEGVDSEPELSDLYRFGAYVKSHYYTAKSVFVVLVLALFLILSFIIRLGVKLYLRLFHDPNDLKLLDRPYDEVTASNPRTSNMAFTLRLSGVPLKSKIVKTLDERVVNWKTNISFEKESVPEYEPYESLRWRITNGFFYHYWKRDRHFNVADHVVFEKCTSVDELESVALRASEFYHNHKWISLKGRRKPQWEFKVIAPVYPVNFPPEEKEFVIVFAAHHAYGDAFSCLHMLQYALSDVKPPQNQSPPAPSESRLETPSEISNTTSTILSKSRDLIDLAKRGISIGGLIITEISRLREVTRDHTHYCRVPDSKRHCGVARYSLSQMKSVVTADGAPVAVTAVVLACTSKVYKRLYKEQKPTESSKNVELKKAPNSILAFMPYAIWPYEKLGLLNNFANSYTTVPVGQEFDTQDSISERHQVMSAIQKSMEESSTRENLEASWMTTCLMSLLAFPFQQLGFAILPSPSVLYTNVPATIPRHLTFFGGYKMKDFFGFTMLLLRCHATISSTIDSSNNTVSLSLVVDDSAIEVCPKFLEQFFKFFQEELDHLVSESMDNQQDDESEMDEQN